MERDSTASRRDPPWTSSLAPAPGDLRVVQAFVNTRDLEAGTDELATRGELNRWLVRWGLIGEDESVGEADLARAIEVREGLRGLLQGHGDGPQDAAEVHRLDREARRALLTVRFDADGSGRLEPAGDGWSRALARLLEIVVRSGHHGLWPRLKVCASDACRWAFYDFSKNRSGKWCTMRRCGNQQNARAYRRRVKRRSGPRRAGSRSRRSP